MHRAKILALALATGQQQQATLDRLAHASHRGQGRAHVGGLGIIYPAYSPDLTHEAGAVGQAFKTPQHGQLRLTGNTHRIAQGHGGQGIGLVMGTDDLHLVHGQQRLAMQAQPQAPLAQGAAITLVIQTKTLP